MGSTQPETVSTWRRYRNFLRWFIIVVCAAGIVAHFARNRTDLRLILAIPWQTLLAIIGLQSLNLVLHSLRFRLSVEKCGEKHIPFPSWFRLVVLGRLLNRFVPQMGTIYQGVKLKEKHQISYTQYITSKFSFMWMDWSLTFATALVITWIYDASLRIGGFRVVEALIGILFVTVISPFVLDAVFRTALVRVRWLAWLAAKVSAVLQATVRNLRDYRYVAKIVLFGGAIFGLRAMVIFLCFRGMAVEVKLPAIVLFCALLKVGDHVKVTPGNLGVRELVFGVLSKALGMGISQGILVSVIRRLLLQIVVIALVLGFRIHDLIRKRSGSKAGN